MASNGFQFQQFFIRHDRCAMRVGTDGVLLGAWAHCPVTPTTLQPDTPPSPLRILDIGTGTGLVALMMAQRYPDALVDALEIDADAAAQAACNCIHSPWTERLTVIPQSIQDFVATHTATTDGLPQSDNHERITPRYDAITCNPPFFIDSMKCPDGQRTLARHSDTLSPHDLMTAAKRLLKPAGELSIVIPVDMITEYEAEAAFSGLLLTRMTTIRTVARKAPKRALLAFSPTRLHTADIAEQILMENDNSRSPWYKMLTKEFYIK